MKYYFTLIVFCTAIVLGHSQVNPEKQLGSWYMLYGTFRVSDKISINTGIELRYYEIITNYNLDLFGTGMSYHINPKTALTVNYSYLDIDRSIEFTEISNTIEHRLYEQINNKHNLWNLPINHRLRIEHRFLHTINDNTIQNRLRYRLGTKIKLNKTLYIAVSNEIFVNFTEDVFRENRTYAALGIRLHKTLKLQLGYMKQHINNLNLDRLQIGIYLNTDLRKTQ
ncbi:DUF2490 domain-containing protein [Psychroserpens luteus]|uniref:DUF2490 domain-containing protein n=1 Tax=Psychroserpens luteus TaxID=1434066 RepID=A0ABW5ZQC4_9FLAO|nr:DUF2490 domain-containing protein [Psychroserpens luteus]